MVSACEPCHKKEETIGHLFFKCEFAKLVCFGSRLTIRVEALQGIDGRNLLVDQIISMGENKKRNHSSLT